MPRRIRKLEMVKKDYRLLPDRSLSAGTTDLKLDKMEWPMPPAMDLPKELGAQRKSERRDSRGSTGRAKTTYPPGP